MQLGLRGQAALEYLMTYGWAILVVLIIGVAMWQMGVFSPAPVGFGKEGFSQVTVIDAKLSGDQLTLYLSNDGGTRLLLQSITANISNDKFGEDPGTDCMIEIGSWSGDCFSVFGVDPDGVMRPGRNVEVNLTCSSGTCIYTSGKYYRANVAIEYTNQASSISHKSSGQVWGTSE